MIEAGEAYVCFGKKKQGKTVKMPAVTSAVAASPRKRNPIAWIVVALVLAFVGIAAGAGVGFLLK